MNYTVKKIIWGMLVPFVVIVMLGAIIGGIMWGIPRYKLYKQDLVGQANLRQQEWEKQILIEEAKAELESATLKASAEIERAKGVAKANEIIGDSLQGNEAYIKWMLADGLKDQNTQLIYVPTEAGLPILEANRQSEINLNK
jgi:hypothetical protein